jgi:hypothetical protein
MIVFTLGFGIFVGLAPARSPDDRPAPDARPVAPRPGFFGGAPSALPPPLPQLQAQPVHVEFLLGQIERHMRLEQAAVESFLECPTLQNLHAHTDSPLAN